MKPSTKVTAASAAAALTTLLIWIAQSQGWVDDIPGGLEAAVTTLLTLLAGYFVPESNPAPSARATIANEG